MKRHGTTDGIIQDAESSHIKPCVGIGRTKHIGKLQNQGSFQRNSSAARLMGSELHLHLAANGQDVVAVIPTANIDPMAYARHTSVKFGFDAKLVHLFDSDSEKNLI